MQNPHDGAVAAEELLARNPQGGIERLKMATSLKKPVDSGRIELERAGKDLIGRWLFDDDNGRFGRSDAQRPISRHQTHEPLLCGARPLCDYFCLLVLE